MIPAEKAQKYIAQHQKPEVDRFEFRSFSQPYRRLGQILGRIKKEKYEYYNSNNSRIKRGIT